MPNTPQASAKPTTAIQRITHIASLSRLAFAMSGGTAPEGLAGLLVCELAPPRPSGAAIVECLGDGSCLVMRQHFGH